MLTHFRYDHEDHSYQARVVGGIGGDGNPFSDFPPRIALSWGMEGAVYLEERVLSAHNAWSLLFRRWNRRPFIALAPQLRAILGGFASKLFPPVVQKSGHHSVSLCAARPAGCTHGAMARARESDRAALTRQERLVVACGRSEHVRIDGEELHQRSHEAEHVEHAVHLRVIAAEAV